MMKTDMKIISNTRQTTMRQFATKQQGSALLLCIVLLIAMTYLAISSVSTGVMEIRMSSAIEEELNAFQIAQSAIDFTASDFDNLPFTGALNTAKAVTLTPATNPGDMFYAAPNSGDPEIVTVTAERSGACAIPPRTKKPNGKQFKADEFIIRADVDKTATRRGISRQTQGIILIGTGCANS